MDSFASTTNFYTGIQFTGVANMVRGDWLKPAAVVIKVGINSIEDPNTKRGY